MTRDCLFVEVKFMDFNRILSMSVVLFAFQAIGQAPKSPFPKIKEIEGVVQDLSMQPTRTLKKRDRLLEKFHARLSDPSSELVLELYEKLELEAFSGSEFLMPNISWETRQISEIQLLRGSIQLDSSSREYSNLKIKSPLFEVSVPEGNLLLSFDPVLAVASLMVFKGDVVFGGLNAEETVTLKSGEKVSFQGVKEEDEISYDLLLQGRKVPKGKLGPVEKITNADLKKYSPDGKLKKKQEQLLLAQKKRQKNSSELNGQICRHPAAPMNYCEWSLNAKKQCVRRRCTADGLWKDPQTVSETQCQSKNAQVKPCDY